MRYHFFIMLSLISLLFQAVDIDQSELRQMNEKVRDLQGLINEAELIINGRPEGDSTLHRTGRMTPSGELVIFIQPFVVKNTIWGSEVEKKVQVIRPGIEPLPPIDDPINKRYPGPLADDVDYILFLKELHHQHLYYVIGMWQGVYPLDPDGRTIALLGEGFTGLHGLTIKEVTEKVESEHR